MAPSTLTAADYRALAEFRYCLARFLAFSAAAAKAVGLEPRQHQALLAIKGWPDRLGITVGELAERLQMRHNSAVGLVDRLSRRGLLRRVPDRRDHRVIRLRLTPAGTALIVRLSTVHHQELKQRGPELRRRLDFLAGPVE